MTASERKRVRVFVRIEGHNEVFVGTARTVADIPALLQNLADTLIERSSPDELETPPVTVSDSLSSLSASTLLGGPGSSSSSSP